MCPDLLECQTGERSSECGEHPKAARSECVLDQLSQNRSIGFKMGESPQKATQQTEPHWKEWNVQTSSSPQDII